MRISSLIVFALCYLLGTVSLWYWKQLPAFHYPWLLGASCLLFYGLLGFIKSYRFLSLALLLNSSRLVLVMLGGFFFCVHASQQVIYQRIPQALEGIPLRVVGEIISIPDHQTHNTHFEFLIQKCESIEQTSTKIVWPMPAKIRLSWYSTANAPQPALMIGETWQFLVKLKQARSTFNPASFDYEAWLFSHRITAIGSIIYPEAAQKIASSLGRHFLDHWRTIIQKNLQQAIGNTANFGLIEAITIGLQNDLTAEQWRIMQATGTNHLVAIAGLHVGFVFSFVFMLSQLIWRKIPWLMLWKPARESAILIALLAATYYSALAGFALPTQRALSMLSVALAAAVLRRNIPPWHALSLGLLVVLFLDPLSVFSQTFFLSFIAVAVIIFACTDQGSQLSWFSTYETEGLPGTEIESMP